MKNLKWFLVLALVFVAGCNPYRRDLMIYTDDSTGAKRISYIGTYDDPTNQGAVNLAKAANTNPANAQGMSSVERTSVSTSTYTYNNAGSGGYVEPQINVPRQQVVAGSLSDKARQARLAAQAGGTSEGEDSNFNEASSELSSKRVKVLGEAKNLLDKSYQLGATGPNAYDCSAFTRKVFGECRVEIPRSSSAQSTVGRPVNRQFLQPGDLVCWPGHVGIFTGQDLTGREVVIHANSTAGRVSMSYLEDVGPPTGYRNILD